MTEPVEAPFPDARCNVVECPYNHGDAGLSCGFMSFGGTECLHHKWRRTWNLRNCDDFQEEVCMQP